MDAIKYITSLAKAARKAGAKIAVSSGEMRNAALVACAAAIRESRSTIQQANELDLEAARSADLPAAMIKRLVLDDSRIEA
ncbi:MAG TPA: gamma-glutamyl-phosphate reductase, partial [Phycisphaerae bacterium]|nr:gamma-glutamyl-phosphate reductase [Phycisphaerae bacterium]